jgi:multiple sugar transport system permease protein
MRRRVDRIVNAVAVVTFCFMLFPFYWMIASSVKGPEDLLSVPPSFVPPHLSLHYYRQLFGALRLDLFFRNSVVLSVGTAVITVVLASLGAYGVLAYRFAVRTAAARLILFVYMKTLSVIIVDFNTREGTLRGEILASSVVIAIPSFLFALFAQRYLVSGLTAGATKA